MEDGWIIIWIDDDMMWNPLCDILPNVSESDFIGLKIRRVRDTIIICTCFLQHDILNLICLRELSALCDMAKPILTIVILAAWALGLGC